MLKVPAVIRLLLLVQGVTSFVPSAPCKRQGTTILLGAASPDNEEPAIRPGSLMAATLEQGRVPYGEESRKYRRTVYSHKDWIRHRSSERLVPNLNGMFMSGIVRQLQSEILLMAGVASIVVLWNSFLVPMEFDAALGMTGVPKLSLPYPALYTLLPGTRTLARLSNQCLLCAMVRSSCHVVAHSVAISQCGAHGDHLSRWR